MASRDSYRLIGELNQLYGPAIGGIIWKDFELIRPKAAEIKTHVANDGNETRMACFTLQLSVVPDGHEPYLLPLEVWFPRKFPEEAPIIFLDPNYAKYYYPEVDSSGLIVHPLFRTWSPKANSLPSALQELSRSFSRFVPWFRQEASQQHSRIVQPPSSSLIPSAILPSSSTGGGGADSSGKKSLALVTRALLERAQLQRTILEADLLEDVKTRDKLRRDRELIEHASTKMGEAEENITCSVVLLGQALVQAADMGKIPVVPVDEIVVSDSEINQQLLDTVTTDHAYADLLYQLERGLTRGVLTVDQCIRLCREMAREQFKEKALAKKILIHQQSLGQI